MNVAPELADSELYNYDVLVKLLSDRFDPAARVSASRSRFHGRFRRHHADADAFTDALAVLCRVGYPQSPPELRQELTGRQNRLSLCISRWRFLTPKMSVSYCESGGHVCCG